MKFCYLIRLLRIWDDPKYLGGWRFILLSDQISKLERLDNFSKVSLYSTTMQRIWKAYTLIRTCYLPHSSYILTHVKSVLVNTISF